MSTTLIALKRQLAKDGYGYASGTCSAAGTTTTIVDTSGDSPLQLEDSASLFQQAWAMIEADSAGTPLNVGEVRRIATYTPSTGQLATAASRGFSNATTTTQSYGVFFGIPPARYGVQKGMEEYFNAFLRQHHYRHWSLLTLVTDGDMETSGVANWTATNATVAKVTTAASVDKGKQGLSITTTAALGYAESVAIAVTGNRAMPVVADVKVTAGDSAKLELWDKTNDATIDSVTTSDTQPMLLWLNADIPSTCKSVAVRLVGVGNGDIAVWDNISFRYHSRAEISAPSWLTERWQAENIRYTLDTGYSSTSYTRTRDLREYPQVYDFDLLEDYGASTPFRVRFSDLPHQSHVFLVGIRPFGELSADTDTTDADKDWLCRNVLAEIYAEKDDKAKAAYWAARAAEVDMEPRWSGRLFKAVKF